LGLSAVELAEDGEHWKTARHLIEGPEAVQTAEHELSERCKNFPKTEYRKSLCWPAQLGA
jgi:hypothetical protein